MTSASSAQPRLEIPARLIQQCEREVDRTFPNESGGVLMGHRLEGRWIIDFVVGPGPTAKHEPYRFSPDLDWQHAQIADRFNATNGRSTYLGDWHSHPRARSGALSPRDIGVIKKIIRSPDALCAEPLMVILWGGEPRWNATAWCGRFIRRRFLPGRFELRDCAIDR